MDRRAVSIGGVAFDYKLFVAEYESPSNFRSEVEVSEAGSHIVWQQEIVTPYITLESRENGWIEEATMRAIKALYEDIGTESHQLTYADGSIDQVRFAREKGISFTPLYEGACWFTTKINLAKV